MAMVRFATLCDNPKCLKRSREYEAFPTCRSCGNHVCHACAEPFTAHEDEINLHGQDVPVVTVQCGDCLEGDGPDALCIPLEEQDEAEARSAREYRELYRGEL